MPALGLPLRGLSCFCLFSLARLPSPKERHAQASRLEDERHGKLGQVPSAAQAEDSLDEQRVSQPQNMQVSPAKISRTTPSGLDTGEINSSCRTLRFCDHLLHGILVAIGNLYMVPVCLVFFFKVLIYWKIHSSLKEY